MSKNVPQIPTTAEIVDEGVNEVLDRTLEDLDERLFYVFDRYPALGNDEFQEFVKRALEDVTTRVLEKIGDWE